MKIHILSLTVVLAAAQTGRAQVKDLADLFPAKTRVYLEINGIADVVKEVRGLVKGSCLEDPPKPPAGFRGDWAYGRLMGRIAMYEPTGTGKRLYPTPLKGPAKIYDVHYGHISRDSRQVGFSPRFGVDDYGRICYPNTLTRSVALMDNAGNEILRFGTYGNIDDWRKLEGRWSEAKAIPLSWPGAVDATDRWIYVADHANIGVLRLAKTFAAAKTVKIQ